jgi:hypothetical protein
MNKLRAVLHHPTTNLVVALILVSTSLIEVWESITGGTVVMAVGEMAMKVGAYDGVLAYGLVHLMRAIAELVEDIERGARG